MTRQRRITIIGSLGVAVLLAGLWFLVGGNRAPTDAPVAVGTDAEPTVIETSAEGSSPPTTAPVSSVADSPPDTTPSSTTTEASGGFVFDFPDDTDFPDGTDFPDEAGVRAGDQTVVPSTTPSSTIPATTSTTTTIPAPVVDASFNRSVFLKEGWVAFGTDAADPFLVQVGDNGPDALAAAIATFGDPTSDTGLVEDDNCSSLRVRRVRFGGLELVLAEQLEEVVTFEQWFIDGEPSNGVPLEIEDGLTPGMTVDDLLAIDVLMVVFQDDDGSGSFKMPGDTSNSPVWGRTSGTSATDTVTSIWSGTECRRL